MEKAEIYLFLCGVSIMLLGGLMLLVQAYRTRLAWGVVCTFFFPLLLLFAFVHWKPSRWPVVVFLIGAAAFAVPYGTVWYSTHFVDLSERDKMVDGERHLTLTGWDKSDYLVLRSKGDTVVLQMANPDVTDLTLNNIKDMANLKELDVSNSAVTDACMVTLKSLPKLEVLRLQNTKITDDGFNKELAKLEQLKMLDLRGTGVSRATAMEWKAAKPGRRVMANEEPRNDGSTDKTKS